jgi:hypothetical protein
VILVDLIGNLLDTPLGAIGDLLSAILGILFGGLSNLPGLPGAPIAPELPVVPTLPGLPPGMPGLPSIGPTFSPLP